jgi:uncharacterized protein YndB with AHSA1/START domain
MNWTQTTASWPIPAIPGAVFRALSDPAELEAWFAEHAEVEATPGGAYRFWGRHTLGTPSAEEATQRLTELVPDQRLAFTWRVMGVESQVVLALTPEGEATKVTAKHTLEGELDVPRPHELIDDFWRLSFGNLTVHLGGGAALRPDFSDPEPEIRMSLVIDASPEAVFRALMDPELVNRWTGSTSAAIDVEAGTYSYGWQYEHEGKQVTGGPTRILELVPNRRLVLDWPDWRGDPSVTGQTISFTLTQEGSATRVDFVHSGFTRAADISDYPFGWDHFLGELEKVVLQG